MRRHFLYLIFPMFATLIAGCAAPVARTPESDRAIKSVAVVSLLSEETHVDLVGLTVFNNKSTTIDQTGALHAIAIDTVEARLRMTRPDWQIRDARASVPALAAAGRVTKTPGNVEISQLTPQLANLAATLDVDLLFVATDYVPAGMPGRGLGVLLRTMSLSSVKTAAIQCFCVLILVDRNGKQVAHKGAGEAWSYSVPATDLGLDYDLSSIESVDTQRKLKLAMQERLRVSMEAAAKSMGY